MSIVDEIKLLDIEVDKQYYENSLVGALELYHSMIENGVIQPRENQLNKSGFMPSIVHFNSK